MLRLISRRIFLALTAGALAAPKSSWARNEAPTLLDHVLLGCSELDRGIALVEESTGVRAAFGGVHPGQGTQNALLSLGDRRYLEIIAPDPKQSGAGDFRGLKGLSEPRLVGWAAHPGDIQALAARLAKASVAANGPFPGSRKRPDGRVLNWKILSLKDDASHLLPFFIEWSADSLHPSADSPKGCSLLSFETATPDPDALAKQTDLLGLDLPIVKADKPQLRATISGPKGQFSVTS
jgi:hypothetical protein